MVWEINVYGHKVRGVPYPKGKIFKTCFCGQSFWTHKGYRGHYALAHILYLRDEG